MRQLLFLLTCNVIALGCSYAVGDSLLVALTAVSTVVVGLCCVFRYERDAADRRECMRRHPAGKGL